METLSRKEQLAAYKREKELAAKTQPTAKTTRSAANNKENTVTQPKAPQTNKLGTKKPLQPSKATIKSNVPNNKEKIALKAQRAGQRSVAPTTPIGKLKQRLQTALTPKAIAIEPISLSEELQSAIPVDLTSELQNHVSQGTALYDCSITSGRAYFSDIPTEAGMSAVVKLPLYWLSWAKLEEKHKEFEFAESLYVRAMGLVEGKAAQSAIKVAYDAHLVQAENAYIQCLDKLLPETSEIKPAGKAKEVHHFVPKSVATVPKDTQASTQECVEHRQIGGVFQSVNVAETRQKFEARAAQSIQSSTVELSQCRVSELSAELLSKPLRAMNLPGAVALPGLARKVEETDEQEPRGADLNLLLGIYDTQTPAKPSTPPTSRRIESHSATKRSSLQELLDDARDARATAAYKPRGRAQQPIHIAAGDISDDDSYNEMEIARAVPDVSTESNTVANTVLACPVKAVVKPLRKRTRMVNFTEVGEMKEDPGRASKKRKGTPFKSSVAVDSETFNDDNLVCSDIATPIRRRSRRLSRSSDL